MAAITFTVQSLIRKSLQVIGAIGQGESLPDADANDALDLLNGLIDSYGTQRLTIPVSSRDVYELTAGKQTYTIGPGGDFNTIRPPSIDQINWRLKTAPLPIEYPMREMRDQAWQNLALKDLSIPFPTAFYYNETYPLGTLQLWPVPTDPTNYDIVIYTPVAVATFANLTTSVSMPYGYYRMLYYNLAVELTPTYGKQLDPVVAREAQRSLADIMRMNLEPIDLATDPALPMRAGVYNIYSDSNR